MKAKTEQDYADLVPQQNEKQPRFMSMVALLTSASVQLQRTVESISRAYDLDLAMGKQLDVIGEWVGISRQLPVPITGTYFEWEGTDDTGWEVGVWQGPFDPDTGLTMLNDGDYRRLIRTKILVNNWDGSAEQMRTIWNQFLPDGRLGIVVDDQDMTIRLGFDGGPLTTLQSAIMSVALPLIKPSTVRISDIFSASSDRPIFAWDDGPGWEDADWSILIDF